MELKIFDVIRKVHLFESWIGDLVVLQIGEFWQEKQQDMGISKGIRNGK